MRHLLDQVLPEKNKEAQENYAELLENLRYFNVTTVKNLKDIITRNWDNLRELEADIVSRYPKNQDNERMKKGVGLTHVGMVRQALEFEFGEEFRKYSQKYLIDPHIKVEIKIEKLDSK